MCLKQINKRENTCKCRGMTVILVSKAWPNVSPEWVYKSYIIAGGIKKQKKNTLCNDLVNPMTNKILNPETILNSLFECLSMKCNFYALEKLEENFRTRLDASRAVVSIGNIDKKVVTGTGTITLSQLINQSSSLFAFPSLRNRSILFSGLWYLFPLWTLRTWLNNSISWIVISSTFREYVSRFVSFSVALCALYQFSCHL